MRHRGHIEGLARPPNALKLLEEKEDKSLARIREAAQPPRQVFALATPAHMLEKLWWEIEQLKRSLEPDDRYRISGVATYHAFNCAITSWHITDWVWESFGAKERQHLAQRLNGAFDVTAKDALTKFQDVLRAKHRSLHICWQIATGSKHKNIGKPDPVIKVEEIWVNQSQAGIMRCGEPLGWHRQDLIVYDDEKKRRAVEVFEEAADCWDRELRSWGFLEDRFISGDD
jgi:hypothetical protein